MTSTSQVKKRGFFERFYNDPFTIEPESLDEKTKKISRIISFLGGLGWCSLVIFSWVTKSHLQRHPDEGVFYFLLGIGGSWVGYRILRFIVWVFRGKPSYGLYIDQLSNLCKKVTPILIVLMLTPIVLHLWGQMIDPYWSWDFHWNIISISNDVPSN
jgi:hypothetical protein